MRVLYLDVLVMLNTIIDYFALKISCELCGKSIRNVRIAIASAAGGVLSLLILLEIPSNTASFALKLISSAIVSFIAVTDLDKSFKQLGDPTYNYTMPYLMLALVYLVLVLLISWGVRALEAKMKKSER